MSTMKYVMPLTAATWDERKDVSVELVYDTRGLMLLRDVHDDDNKKKYYVSERTMMMHCGARPGAIVILHNIFLKKALDAYEAMVPTVELDSYYRQTELDSLSIEKIETVVKDPAESGAYLEESHCVDLVMVKFAFKWCNLDGVAYSDKESIRFAAAV